MQKFLNIWKQGAVSLIPLALFLVALPIFIVGIFLGLISVIGSVFEFETNSSMLLLFYTGLVMLVPFILGKEWETIFSSVNKMRAAITEHEDHAKNNNQ